MYGNIIFGSHIYGNKQLGVYSAEVQYNLSKAETGVLIRPIAVFSSWHTVVRNADLDITLEFVDTIDGEAVGIGFGCEGGFDEFGSELEVGIEIGASANISISELIIQGPVGAGISCENVFSVEHPNQNVIWWSNIGEFDFDISDDNVAGNLKLPVNGYIYAMHQLGNSANVVVYCANGIFVMKPSDVYWGWKKLSSVGIKNKLAVVTTLKAHYYVTQKNELWMLTEQGMTKLGFQEYLATMDSISMTYDEFNNFVYICDGTIGYIYSLDTESFVAGPVSITGYAYQDEIQYITATEATITRPAVSLSTDIYDFGTKKEKTIFKVILSGIGLNGLNMNISYRADLNSDFALTPTIPVSITGQVTLPCYGREFKFNLFSDDDLDDLAIDSMTIVGIVHGANYLDTVKL